MHYLKHDPGYRSVQQWAIQHRQSISPLTAELAKHVLSGIPLVVSSLAILSASELATIFAGESRLVAVAEKIDTRRSTAMGDLHWNTLKLLAPVFGKWATAAPVDSSKGEDVGKLKAEVHSLRERVADLTVELTMLRGSRAPAQEFLTGTEEEVAAVSAMTPAELATQYEAAKPALPPTNPPEGPELWEAVKAWLAQPAYLSGVKLIKLDDDSLFLSSPVEIPPDEVTSIEDGLMAVGLRHRECFVMVEPEENDSLSGLGVGQQVEPQSGSSVIGGSSPPAGPEGEIYPGDMLRVAPAVPESGGASGNVERRALPCSDQSGVPDGFERVLVPDGVKATDFVDANGYGSVARPITTLVKKTEPAPASVTAVTPPVTQPPVSPLPKTAARGVHAKRKSQPATA